MSSSSSTQYCLLGNKEAAHGLIFLHGWKQGGLNMRKQFKAALGSEALKNTVVYFLTATRTVDDNGSEPQWFTYRTDDKLAFETDELLIHRQRLHQLLERLRSRHRKRGGTVSIGGYSQGACMAVDVAMTARVPLRVLCVSGFAMLPRMVSAFGWHGYEPPRARIRLWTLHGRQDSEITCALGRRSYEALCNLGDTIVHERAEFVDADHWDVWDTEEASELLRAFLGEPSLGDGAADGDACADTAPAADQDAENVMPNSILA
jgi:predicted esterase